MNNKKVLSITAIVVSLILIVLIIASVVKTEIVNNKNLYGNGAKEVKMNQEGLVTGQIVSASTPNIIVFDNKESPTGTVTIEAPGTAWFRIAPNLYERFNATNGYEWKNSSKGVNEYYLAKIGGANPGVENWEEVVIYQTTQGLEQGIVGNLSLNPANSVGQWAMGDNDNLGFNTFYVRYNTALPFVITASHKNTDFSWGVGTAVTNDITWEVVGQSEQPKRQGFNAAFFFDKQGTYTISVKVTNQDGETTTTTREVQVLKDSRKQIYISTNGSDTTGDGSETNPYKTLAGAKAKADAQNTHYRLRRGDKYIENVTIRPGGSNTVISSYGDENLNNPEIAFVNSAMFQFGAPTQVLMDVIMGRTNGGVILYMDGREHTIYNVDFKGDNNEYSYAMSSNELQYGAVMNVRALGLSNAYKIWFGGNNVLPGSPYKNLVVYDNNFGPATSETVTRGGSDFVTFEGNTFVQKPNLKGTIRMMYGNYWSIINNQLEEGSVALQIPAGPGGARVGNVVIANNLFVDANVGGGSNKATMENIMVRGNIFDVRNFTIGAIPGTAISFSNNKPSGFTIAHNTYYANSPNGKQPVFITIAPTESTIPWLKFENNLGVANYAQDGGDPTFSGSFGKIRSKNETGNDIFTSFKNTISWSFNRTGYHKISSSSGNGAGDGLGITTLGGSGWATYSWNFINNLSYGGGNKELKNVNLNSEYEVVEGEVAIGSYVLGVHTDFYGNKIRPGDTGLKVGAVQKATKEIPKGLVCGNAIVEGLEECDDGNKNNQDSCSNQCKINTQNKNNKTLDFDGKKTTNLTNISNLSKVDNFMLEKSGKGEIVFMKEINFKKYNNSQQVEDIIQKINNYIKIYEKTIIIDSQQIPELNESATITIYNLTETKPKILMDGQTCPAEVCKIISYNKTSGTLTFTVTHFTNYTIIEEPTTPTTPTNPSGGGVSGGGGSTTSGTKKTNDTTNNIITSTINNENNITSEQEEINNQEITDNKEKVIYNKLTIIILSILAIALLVAIIIIIKKNKEAIS